MQDLCRIWERQCDWGSNTATSLPPPSAGPAHLNGSVLNRLGQQNAFELADAGADYVMVGISEDIQIIAMAANLRYPLDREKAKAGARMLFEGGDELLRSLRTEGILRTYETDDGEQLHDCTCLGAVLQYFVNIVYVFVRSPGASPHAHIPEPFCKCGRHCRYAGCQHAEYVKTFSVRLRAASTSTDNLPEIRRRGRKLGQTLTQRGAANAKAKLMATATAAPAES